MRVPLVARAVAGFGLVAAVAAVASRPRSTSPRELNGVPMMSVASSESLIRSIGAPPSTCLHGPSSPEEQARYRSIVSAEESGATAHQTLAELKSLDDRALLHVIIGRLSNKVVFRGTAALTRAELAIHLVDWLMDEVDNGGFRQFFFNSAGDCSLQTADALRDLGVPELVALYARVLATFPGGHPPEDRSERWRIVDGIPGATEAWSRADHEFYKVDTRHPLERYARAHLDELDLPPET